MNKNTFPMRIGAVLFEGFELLDVFGPLEMFGMLPDRFEITMVAEHEGAVRSNQGPAAVAEASFATFGGCDILLIPGGRGTRREVDNPAMIDFLSEQGERASHVTTVCTGTALLAKTGLLDGRRATSNKLAFKWVMKQGPGVKWIPEARWVEDGRFFTAAGVSAGMDMALGLIEHLLGKDKSEQVARQAEYEWHSDKSWDPFALKAGLVDRGS